MASKYQMISALADYTAGEITNSGKEWGDFLTTAGRMYKYPFEDQILIYAQRPGATACASMEIWNEKMMCWVNKGARGIALIDRDYGAGHRLKYVFDVADVSESWYGGRKPVLWEMRERDREGVLQQLEETYGATDENLSFEERIYEISKSIADETYEDILPELAHEMGFGDSVDADLAGRFRDTLASSIAYMTLSRCNADMDAVDQMVDFSYIQDFQYVGALAVLGNSTADLAKPLLMEIARAVRTAEKNLQKNILQEMETGREEEYAHDNEKATVPVREEGVTYGDELHSSRGLSDSGSDRSEGAGGRPVQVGTLKDELSEGEPQGSVRIPSAEREAEGALPRNPESGRGEDGNAGERIIQETAGGREPEGLRPDGVGSEDEQYPEPGRGDRPLRADLYPVTGEARQITFADLFPSFEEQLGTVAAAEAKQNASAAFSLPQNAIAEIIRSGSGRENSRKHIYAKYQAGYTPEQMADFIRAEYGKCGKGFVFDGKKVSVWFDENGMTIGGGSSAFGNILRTMTWQEIEAEIRSQIEAGTYMSASEVFLIPQSESHRIANSIFFFFRDGLDEHPEVLGMDTPGFPEAEQHLSEMLLDKDGVQVIIAELEKEKASIDSGEKILRWRYIKSADELLTDCRDMSAEKVVFPANDEVSVRLEDFITQDEIDADIRGGSGVSQGHFRIQEYFEAGHDTRDNIAFLKDEYGIGGRAPAIIGTDKSNEEHDAKGIRLEKGSIMEPYTKTLLSWNVVEKRIREMVAEGSYLTAEQKAGYENYKAEKIQNMMEAEQERLAENNEETVTAIEEPEEIEDKYIDDGFLIPDEAWAEDSGWQPIADEDNPFIANEQSNVVEFPQIDVYESDDMITSANENYVAMEAAENFHITDEHLGEGTPKEKFRKNMDAIYLLKKLENEGRQATSEEQVVFSQYVGWGGLSDAFDEDKRGWVMQYQELKAALSPEEYASARESTLNAHYTSPEIINAIYDGLRQMGFTKGNVLEPSMGIGNFFGMMPSDMEQSRLYGVELDSLTGRIAKQLYPNANVQIKGFENTDYPNDFFDVAIGNVPFGDYKVADKPYDRLGFQIHDYFFAKALDKVRTGGIVAFVTSKGTLDKASPQARKYLAQKAELLGAVRLPNTAFKVNAGTEVTSDIIFLKKRDRVADLEPDWVQTGEDVNGITINRYFIDHPEQVLGTMEMESGPFGMRSTCVPDNSRPLREQLRDAIRNIEGQMEEAEAEMLEDELVGETIPADPDVKNFSFTVIDGEVYYRENSIMKPVDVSDTAKERIRGMVAIRNATRELIGMQMEEYSDIEIKAKQRQLSDIYDSFTAKYGILNSQGNRRAFSQDSSYCLLCSLENLDDDGNFIGKADMFTKRTIKRAEVVTSVDTASEALAVSLSEKAGVDIPYMSELTGKTLDEITEELTGVIYKNPVTDRWETADEYLSGNVREKLETAKTFAENYPEYAINVQGLTQVMPKDLDASEIEVRIGATWIEPRFIEDFMRDTFETPDYLFDRNVMGVQFSAVTGEWNVKGKNADYGNALANMTFGTSRANAYKILEDSLNLKDVRIYDTIVEDGKEKRVLNKKETTIASQKQEQIREAFKNWVFDNPERRQYLVEKYNRMFNSIRPREYDGSHLTFPGMSPDIELKEHQKNAVAHVLYGNNTLLAHCVGAGKTFEMAASAMESKRLGLSNKALFVVPNHLTEQWASDFLKLYPGANILAATKRDFEPANRKKFCSRIATGDYDAIIIGHSQFEKIPLSQERQAAVIERQIDEIEEAIAEMKAQHGERYTIKQMEKSRKQLTVRLEKLNDQTRKDNVVTFEQLGVDRLFVDESQAYKNLFLYTKMRNVAGIAQSESQRSSDMFAKCQYLDEITGGKGVTFATGTPISNSMTELYTNMRYLQYSTLQKMGLGQFDAWAASFGESQTAIELSPEGSGYRAKTRFARFFNLPELISLFKEAADIQTEDMLNLPVPEAEYENVVLKPSEYQKEMVQSLAERAERVRNRMVDSSVDNMLKITNDGRKLALDQRLMNEMLPADDNSKTAACAERAFKIWQETTDRKCAQLIFCDQSTPKNDGRFNVYDDIKQRLIEKGVPQEEIAFIHDANTETRKAELFAKVRSGQVRFLLGSTQKMGAGTNVQDRLIALHHLDCPWRPSDLSQQEGRILRQGNKNPKVKIFRYVTENTFDSYSWQLIENKQRFIGQIMTSKSPVRSCEDVDEAALSYAEVKALATGNPYIKEKMDLDIQVSKLKLMKANHTSQKYRLEDNITQNYPRQISALSEKVSGYETDILLYDRNKPADKEAFTMKVGDKTYVDRKEAGTAIIAMCREIHGINNTVDIGEYLGFKMQATFDAFNNRFLLNVKGSIGHEIEVGTDPSGNITRINNVLDGMEKQKEEAVQKLSNVEHQLEMARIEVEKPFEKEAELAEKLDRLNELNALLNMDEKGDDALTLDEDEPLQDKSPQENQQQISENQRKEAEMQMQEESDADDKRIEEEKQDAEKCDICGADTAGDSEEQKKDVVVIPTIPTVPGKKPSVLKKLEIMKGVAAGNVVYQGMKNVQQLQREAL